VDAHTIIIIIIIIIVINREINIKDLMKMIQRSLDVETFSRRGSLI